MKLISVPQPKIPVKEIRIYDKIKRSKKSILTNSLF